MNKLKAFIKNETVLSIAAVLAIGSAFIVKPSAAYLGYIDFRTLILLFCLMAVVMGFRRAGALDWLAGNLVRLVHDTRSVCLLLIMLCFFSSMFFTNDVALISFVPLSMLVLRKIHHPEMSVYVVVMQTIAANLGSMLLPVGNPQNLYLYGLSGMSFSQFVLAMLPLWLIALVLTLAASFKIKKLKFDDNVAVAPLQSVNIIYLILFALCLMTVAGFLDQKILFIVILGIIFLVDREILLNVDYFLLLTFVCFFIFIGNLKAVPGVKEMMSSLIGGREMIAGILSSQIISNVPAAILLSGFATDIKVLLWGVDIGGLGTLIASLASLISYKLFKKEASASSENFGGNYMKTFTLMNVLFLVILTAAAMFII